MLGGLCCLADEESPPLGGDSPLSFLLMLFQTLFSGAPFTLGHDRVSEANLWKSPLATMDVSITGTLFLSFDPFLLGHSAEVNYLKLPFGFLQAP